MRVAAVLLATALLLTSGCHSSTASAVLNVGSQKGGTKAIMLAAGVLKGAPYKVSWSEFSAAQTLLEAIGSDAVDTGLVGDAPFEFAYQSGSPIRAIGAQTTFSRPSEYLAIVVPQGSPAHSIAELKGKSITTTRGSVGHSLALRALADAGLPASAVRFVFLAPGDAKAAFDSNAVDAWAIWAPYLTVALKQGGRVITDAHNFPLSYAFDAASENAIARKRALLADFLQREAAALLWAKTHQPELAAALAKETSLPADIARITADKGLRAMVPMDDAVIVAQRDVAVQFAKAGALVLTRPVDAAYDRSFGSKARSTEVIR